MQKIRLTRRVWIRFWLSFGGRGTIGRLATRIAGIGMDPYRGRYAMAGISPNGYVAPSAEIVNVDLKLGKHVLLGERVLIARWLENAKEEPPGLRGTAPDKEYIELADRVHVNRETHLEVLDGGAILVGEETKIQTRCLFVSGVQPIRIGPRVQIAPLCTFFSYDHETKKGLPINRQPLMSKGPIVIDEDVWLGVGVTVLSGVTIGRGAVVGAGAVVARDIPEDAIATGPSARIVRYRH